MRWKITLLAAIALAVASGCSDADPPSAANETQSGVPLLGAATPIPAPACVQELTNDGFLPVCASCACGKCPTQAEACGGDAECEAVIECMFENECQGDRCYCGGAWFCGLTPTGPCRDIYRAAAGTNNVNQIRAQLADPSTALGKAQALAACSMTKETCNTQCTPEGERCFFEDEACQERYCGFDQTREDMRLASAGSQAVPVITGVNVNGVRVWSTGSTEVPNIRPGDRIALVGSGFGQGVDIDFAKIMIGNSRVLETDLAMYDQRLNIFTQVHYETPRAHSEWPSDIIAWNDNWVEFRAPVHVSEGPIRMTVQKRVGLNSSLVRHGESHNVVDALTLRIVDDNFDYACDIVSELGQPRVSNSVPVTVENENFEDLVRRGREIFWSYDYNIGLAHVYRNLDWTAIMQGRATNPITGELVDPLVEFGAFPTVPGQVPAEAIEDVYFDPYPMANPIPGTLGGILGAQLRRGNTRDSGFAGYRYAESRHPFRGRGEWIGFNCASCHGYQITHENAEGESITRVYPGLPNPRWTMRWTVFGDFDAVIDEEMGPSWDPGPARVDKTSIVYDMPAGTGEHNVIRLSDEGSHTDNDYEFSPIVIPNVTHHMPIRRALSHTESYVGFEGSYIHSQEPDGAMGSMNADALKAFTAYMTVLDEHDDDLRNVGVYRWLASRGEINDLAGNATEGQLVANGWQNYPGIAGRVEQGKAIFDEHCASCHTDGFDAHTNERMIRLDQVGRFFAPTIYHRHTQAIRVNYLRNLYWTQHRGLLSDGHVRNLEDLVNPARCTEGSELYNRYYTLHAPSGTLPAIPDEPPMPPGMMRRGEGWRVLRFPDDTATGRERNRFVERHKYFVTVPWDPDHYYWDYQSMRAEYGPHELGTAEPIGMPAAPHPWCASDQSEIDDLVLYLLTL